MKNIVIFGSCVSRDPFEELAAGKYNYYISDYFARSSLASLAGNSSNGYDLSKINSSFQRRMVERDFDKSFLKIDLSRIDLIIVDFIDDRYPLLESEAGLSCTDSHEFRKSDLILHFEKIQPFSNDFFSRWEIGWRKLKSKLDSENSLEKLLVNKVFLSEKDDQGEYFEQVNYIQKMNSWLSRVYNFIDRDISGKNFIEYKIEDFIASSHHKWGKSPFHYVQNINYVFLRELNYFCNFKN